MPVLTAEPGQQSVAQGDPDSPDVRRPPSTGLRGRPRPASPPGGVQGVAAPGPGSQLVHELVQLQGGVLALLAAVRRAKEEGKRSQGKEAESKGGEVPHLEVKVAMQS